MPYKRIMLAIDEDDISQEALHEALYLTKILQAELKVIHVIDEGILSDIEKFPEISEGIKALEYSSTEFLRTIEKIAEEAGVKLETQLIKIIKRNQHIAFEIVDAAQEWSTDLLIIGAYSRPGFHKLLLGHVADSILRITTIPILILHTKYKKLTGEIV